MNASATAANGAGEPRGLSPRIPRRRDEPGGSARVLVAAASTLAVWAWLAAPLAAQSVWELSPYRMELIVALEPSPDWPPQLEAELGRDLVVRCDAVVGAVWDARASAAPPALRPALLWAVDTVTVDSLSEEMLEADKVTLLAVTTTTNGYEVAVRELDVRTQIWGPPLRRPVWQPAKLRDVAFRAVVEAFAPLATIERGQQKTVVLRPRGGALPAHDEAPTRSVPGDVFLPVVRRNDREGKPRGIREIPWTFFSVEGAAPNKLECALYTGLRSPLSGRRRGRIEWLALAVTPPGGPSRLTLQSRTDPKRVLSGYSVVAHPPGSKTTTFLGRTDSRGKLTIEPAAQPLRLLVISSGGVPLARLPVVPGLEPELVAAIPNDDERLEAEGFVTGLQEQMVDLVTRREVLLTRARARIDAGKLEEADAMIEELEALGRAQDDLELELAEQQKATISPDPAIQAKIDKLFSDTRKLMEKHLQDEPVEQVARQLRQARSGK